MNWKRLKHRVVTISAGIDLSREAVLASYPRSGNTWMRAALTEVLRPNRVRTFRDFEIGVFGGDPSPSIVLLQKLGVLPKRIAVKSHDFGWSNIRYKSVVVLVRDPRDVVASFYRHNLRDGMTHLDFPTFAEAAIRGAVRPGTWFDYNRSWQVVAQHQPEAVSFVRYKDLKALDTAAIETVAARFDLPADLLAASMAKLDLIEMRRIEEGSRKPGTVGLRNETPFIGVGAAGAIEWATVDELIRRHARHWFDLIDEIC